MIKIKKTKRDGPEAMIQERIVTKLTLLGWYCVVTCGNIYQTGLPDLYITHTKYGTRWVEVKNPKNYSFTPAQRIRFPLLSANGTGIWILISDSDEEINKLFNEPNWYFYLK